MFIHVEIGFKKKEPVQPLALPPVQTEEQRDEAIIKRLESTVIEQINTSGVSVLSPELAAKIESMDNRLSVQERMHRNVDPATGSYTHQNGISMFVPVAIGISLFIIITASILSTPTNPK